MRLKHLYPTILTLTMMIFAFVPSSYADAKKPTTGFLDVNLYPYLSDVDNDSALTVNLGAKLPNRFSYFSLTNFYASTGQNLLNDSVTYYSEQNLRWQVADKSPFDLTLQMNFRSGADNNRHRLGARWRLNNTSFLQSFFNDINLSYSITLHAVQFDHENPYVWQLEHVFMMKFPSISKRLYLAGFVDQTFNQDLAASMPSSPIVGEVQMGFQLIENLYFVSEYRINQYRRSDVNNLAIGLHYKMPL
jgi:hypothetical protein